MLKGHAKIELKNEQTGEVEVHEHDNMFTQLIFNSLNNKFIEAAAGVMALNSYNTPVHSKHLGGVVLFESPIDEDETNCNFPVGNKVIGYAGTIASDGQDKYWGSRNFLESEEYDAETKTVKYVWDFSTSQANGTISALGLSRGDKIDWYGDAPYSKEYSLYTDATTIFGGTSALGDRVVEFDGSYVTYMVNGVGKVTIKKAKFNFDTVTIDNCLGKPQIIESVVVVLPLTSANYKACMWKDGHDGYWYGFATTNSSFSGTTANNNYLNGNYVYDYVCSLYIQIIRINKETLEVDYHNVTMPSGYFIQPRVSNPIVTKYYVIFPGPSSSGSNEFDMDSEYNVARVRKNEFVRVSKQDWSATVSKFVDEEGNEYSYARGTANYDGFYTNVIFQGQFQNFNLPNGTYMSNDIMLDDNGLVIKQCKPFMDVALGVPATTFTKTGSPYRLSTYPHAFLYGDENDVPHALVLNNKANLILVVTQKDDAVLHYFLIPGFVQTLATINNLDTPVVKTSAQSMKVTYTVSEVVSEE